MLYTVAGAEWSPASSQDLMDSRQVFYRTRSAVLRVARGRPTLGVALRFDAGRGMVFSQGHAPRGAAAEWTAPALSDQDGRVTILASIPGFLVRSIDPPTLRIHPGTVGQARRPRIAGLVRLGEDRL